MFSGIVQEIGTIVECNALNNGLDVSVSTFSLCDRLKVGDSVSVNGVCSTVCSIDEGMFSVQYLPETLIKTTVSRFYKGMNVNLETALTPTMPIGGHFVSGHIDGVGTLDRLTKGDPWGDLGVIYDPAFYPYIAEKGSITVDGVSLTVVTSQKGSFSCCLIPHTFKTTVFSDKKVGDLVNLEFDLLAKQVVHYLRSVENNS